MSIGKKLTAVMAACRYMPLDKTNTFQNYKYTSAAAMFAKINEAMSEQKLYVENTSEILETSDVTNARGALEKYVVMKAKVTIRDAEMSGESVTFEGIGSGQDGSGKAVMKANTAALKYAYIGGLCIAMADDPEETPTPATQAPPQMQRQPQPNQPPPAIQQPPQQPPIQQPPQQTRQPRQRLICSACGAPITQKVADYSQKKYGQYICYECQQEMRQREQEIPPAPPEDDENLPFD